MALAIQFKYFTRSWFNQHKDHNGAVDFHDGYVCGSVCTGLSKTYLIANLLVELTGRCNWDDWYSLDLPKVALLLKAITEHEKPEDAFEIQQLTDFAALLVVYQAALTEDPTIVIGYNIDW